MGLPVTIKVNFRGNVKRFLAQDLDKLEWESVEAWVRSQPERAGAVWWRAEQAQTWPRHVNSRAPEGQAIIQTTCLCGEKDVFEAACVSQSGHADGETCSVWFKRCCVCVHSYKLWCSEKTTTTTTTTQIWLKGRCGFDVNFSLRFRSKRRLGSTTFKLNTLMKIMKR